MSGIKNKKQTLIQRIKVLEQMVAMLYLTEKKRELEAEEINKNVEK